MDEKQELILKGKWCPYCDKATKLISGEVIYGPAYKQLQMYACEQCFSYVGCHKNSTQSLGSVANLSLRALRNKVHKVFDQMWIYLEINTNYSRLEARTAMYMWLAVLMGIEIKYCHVGMFTEEQCYTALHLIDKFHPFKKENNETDS